jgi:beta-1,4-N-acetylglucosaminyltransferase
VSVGNATQPFNRLLEAVKALVPLLPAPVVVQHGHTPFSCVACMSREFLDTERFTEEIATAEVLILHAGAGSALHAIKARKVPVIVPRRSCFGEHVDDHQVEFARQLGAERLAVVVEDTGDLMQAVEEALAMQILVHSNQSQPPLVKIVAEILRRVAHDESSKK